MAKYFYQYEVTKLVSVSADTAVEALTKLVQGDVEKTETLKIEQILCQTKP